jgi:tetratricopeptide (TPR) repeat protein
MANAQTSTPAKTEHAPKASAHDSVTVTANIPKATQKQIAYDNTYQEAMELKKADEYEDALAKFREAEKLASTLDDPAPGSPLTLKGSSEKVFTLATLGSMKNGALQVVMEEESDVLAMLGRFDEAEQILLRRTDVLREWMGEYDTTFAHNYLDLAAMHMLQRDWKTAGKYGQQCLAAYDKIIEHDPALLDAGGVARARREKAMDMYYVGLILFREDKGAESLKMLDECFTTGLDLHVPRQYLVQMATSARNIAIETLHPIDAGKWEYRLNSLPEEDPSKTPGRPRPLTKP